jgi:putative heme-binding domain-containing protein
MRFLPSVFSLFFLLPLGAEDEPSFEDLVAEIREIGKTTSFDERKTSEQLSQRATVEQLASFIGENYFPLQHCAVLALDHLDDPAVLLYLWADDSRTQSLAARAILHSPPLAEQIPELAKALDRIPLDSELVEYCILANLSVASSECVDRLIRLASHSHAPTPFREEALEALLQVEDFSPSHLTTFQKHFYKWLAAGSNCSPSWLKLTLELAEKLKEPPPESWFRKIFLSQKVPIESRLLVLEKLNSLGADTLALVRTAAQASLKIELGQTIRKLPQKPEFKVNSLISTLALASHFSPSNTAHNQDILRFLTILDEPEAGLLIGDYINLLLEENPTDSKTWLEADEAIAKHRATVPAEALRLYEQHRQKARDPLLAESDFLSLQMGGNPERGKTLAMSQKGRCVECHRFGRNGFEKSGPDLLREPFMDQRKLLRSLVAPDAELTPGYGRVTLQLLDDSIVEGIGANIHVKDRFPLWEKDGEFFQLESYAREDIKSLSKTSPMPSVLDYLSPREIRDLMAYLTEGDFSSP